jgi:hypothetical protein
MLLNALKEFQQDGNLAVSAPSLWSRLRLWLAS